MLGVAERFIADDVAPASFSSHDPSIPAHSQIHDTSPIALSRYGDRRDINLTAVVLIIVIHAVLIFVLMQARHHFEHMHEARLSVVNLTPPPPPPAKKTPPPPPSTPQVVAPPPLIQVPVPPLPIATAPEPTPTAVPAVTVVNSPPIAASPPAPTLPSSVQGGNLATQMVSGKPPRYPIESRRKREQGTVVLALTVGIDGAVENLTVAQSSGFPRLDAAARDAVRNWRWKPMMREGQAVRVKGVVEIPFILRSEDR